VGTRRARGGGYFVEEERRATPFARFDEEERERAFWREESVLVFTVILNYEYI